MHAARRSTAPPCTRTMVSRHNVGTLGRKIGRYPRYRPIYEFKFKLALSRPDPGPNPEAPGVLALQVDSDFKVHCRYTLACHFTATGMPSQRYQSDSSSQRYQSAIATLQSDSVHFKRSILPVSKSLKSKVGLGSKD